MPEKTPLYNNAIVTADDIQHAFMKVDLETSRKLCKAMRLPEKLADFCGDDRGNVVDFYDRDGKIAELDREANGKARATKKSFAAPIAAPMTSSWRGWPNPHGPTSQPKFPRRNNAMPVLVLPLRRKWFEQIRDGKKPFTLGYPPKGDTARRIEAPYRGYQETTVTSPEWNNEPREVFAIYTPCHP